MAKCSTGTTTQHTMGHSLRHHCWRHIPLYRVYPAQSLLSTRCIQTAHHPYGFPILFSVNGTEFQRHVCQRIHRHRHETGQLSERHPRQLVHAGLPHRRYSTIWLSVKGVHFKYLFAAGFLLLGLSTMFMYFEVQGAGLYERMKYPVIIRSTGMMFLYSLIPTYATQRMPYKYLSSWICTMLTVRMVLAPSIGAALYTNVLQERQQHYVTRYAQNVDMLHPEAVRLVYPNCTRYAISGKEQTRSNQHGCHIHQRTHPSTSHSLCYKGNGRMDTLCLPDLHDICACRAVS